MLRARYRFLPVAAILVAALGIAACQKQAPAVGATAPAAEKPAESASRATDVAPSLSPAEEKKLVEAAKARKAADGATVWEVIDNAQKQRTDKFKVASVDVEYKKDGTPAAVEVCYWIGRKRLEEDQSCKTIAWEIAPDKQSLKPFDLAQSQAVEAGKTAFLQVVDQMYDKKCGGNKDTKAC